MVRTNNINSKRGFTIIEVVLVLAIAGLIFLMVFIALPALQRSQRNTQRRDDYSMLVAAINSYISNNNGRLGNLLQKSSAGETVTDLVPTRWINTSGEDPNGNQYQLVAYHGVDNSGAGAAWNRSEQPAGLATRTFSYCLDPSKSSTDCGADEVKVTANETPVSQVFIIIQANCNGIDNNGDPMPENDRANRSFAVYGYLEGGGYFCQDSGSLGDKTQTNNQTGN